MDTILEIFLGENYSGICALMDLSMCVLIIPTLSQAWLAGNGHPLRFERAWLRGGRWPPRVRLGDMNRHPNKSRVG
jgi:hypothetical protein